MAGRLNQMLKAIGRPTQEGLLGGLGGGLGGGLEGLLPLLASQMFGDREGSNIPQMANPTDFLQGYQQGGVVRKGEPGWIEPRYKRPEYFGSGGEEIDPEVAKNYGSYEEYLLAKPQLDRARYEKRLLERQPKAHENMNTLMMLNNLMPWKTFPKAGAQMTEGFQEHGGLGQTIPAALRGVLEQFTGEYDPVGPQGVPFKQFMAQKKQLDPKVKSIVDQHVNGLFKK